MDNARPTRTLPSLRLAGAEAGETEAIGCSTAPRSSLPGPWHSDDEFRLDAVLGVADLDRDGPPVAVAYALHRLDDALWQYGFPAYLRHWHQAGLAGEGRLTEVELTTYLVVARKARVLRKTKAIMEAALRGRALSLAELARAGEGPVEDRRKRELGLRERVLWPMDELGAWDASEVPRAARPGAARGVVRYEIGAGAALVAFDARHYRPWLLRQRESLHVVLARCLHRRRTAAKLREVSAARAS